jgi:hypothetical protein
VKHIEISVRDISRRSLHWIALAILFVLVLEVCARVDDRLRWNAPLLGAYSNATLTTSDQYGRHARPRAQFQKWRINSHGFRGPEIAMQKPPGIVRVVVAGASEAFGLYESPGMEFPAQMQTLLDTAQPGRYQVLNAACPGMTPLRIAFYYGAWIRRFEPDILVFYPTPAFYLDVEPPVAGKGMGQPTKATARESFRIGHKAIVVIKRFIPRRIQTQIQRWAIHRTVGKYPAGWVWTTPPPERIELFRAHCLALIDQVRRNGTRVILATHGTRSLSHGPADDGSLAAWRKYYPRAAGTTLLQMERAANDTIRELGRSLGCPVVDVQNAIPAEARFYADFSHFTDEGARSVAHLLSQKVLGSTEPAPAGPDNVGKNMAERQP